MLSYHIKKIGIIQAKGKDALDFLNRMSTNNLSDLNNNEYQKTVLTTDKGRIIDLIDVIKIKDQLLLLTTNKYEDKIVTHLNKYAIIDDVVFEKSNEQLLSIKIFGENLINNFSNLFGFNIQKDIKIKFFKEINSEFAYYQNYPIETISILSHLSNINEYIEILNEEKQMTDEEYEIFRIENGIPEGPNELNEQINPKECNLEKFISYTKGCYIGQEVIARLDAQGKVPKKLVLINSEDEIKINDKIYIEGKEAGFISSSSLKKDLYVGLGFIRSIHLDINKNYSIKRDNKEFNITISKIF